jgi:cytochrome P450
MSEISSIDLLAPELVADPYPALARLRAESPVCWNERHGAWLVTRFDDVSAGFRDPRLSSDRVGSFLPERPAARREDPEDDPTARILSNWMEFKDPPDHTRLRRLVQKAFTPRTVESLRPRIEEIVEELLCDLAGAGRADFVRSFAYPLPATVIAEMLGVPVQDRDLFKGWSDDILGLVFGAGASDRHARARRGFGELEAYIDERLRRARARTREQRSDDLLSALAAAEEQGDVLSRDEVIGTCVLLLFGGHETTTNLLGTSLWLLHRHPEVRERLQREPGLFPQAIEEFLRFDGPSKMMVRWPIEDLELRGRKIRRGERVFLMQNAANRDPEAFPEPDRLELARRANAHLGFGFGIHYCLGAPLARLEAQLALPALLRRFPELRVETDTPEWNPTLLSRGLRALPIVVGAPSVS